MTDQQEAISSIAEQIRERVRQADQDLIAKRADAAATVATKLHERDELTARLAVVEKELSGLVTSATTDLMTARELADFIGVRPADLPAKQTRRAPRKRRSTVAE